jgi:dTDP-4-dehydrorhamnose reductase
MVILLAGAGGQLGRDLQPALHGNGAKLHPFDHRLLDIADAQAVNAAVDRVHPDWIINAAAFNDVDRAEKAPDQAFAVNAAGAGNLADAAARVGAAVVHISTDYVFDGAKGAPYTEDDRPNPLSIYARTKYEGEQRVLASGAPACVLRTAWLYGWQGKNFVRTILAAAERGGPLRVVADQVGSPTATRDLSEAIAALIERGGVRGLFHVVNSGACSRFEFAKAIVGGRVEVLPITTAEAARVAPRPKYSALTSARWPATGLPVLTSWEVALDRFLGEKQAPEH